MKYSRTISGMIRRLTLRSVRSPNSPRSLTFWPYVVISDLRDDTWIGCPHEAAAEPLSTCFMKCHHGKFACFWQSREGVDRCTLIVYLPPVTRQPVGPP